MFQPALDYSIARIRQNAQELTAFPEVAENGHWQCVADGGWVGGHWVGLLWLAYAATRDDAFACAARAWAARLAPRMHDTSTHDLGFLFEPSHLRGLELTGDAVLRPPALAAAQTLAQRFNPRGGFIPAWGGQPGRAIVDTLMNLSLLYWAAAETGEPEYARRATAHARNALAHQVRADGSTAHVADYDPDTGAFLKQDTHQGLSPTSCWSRGQSWAVYGFAECYRHTREEAFLSASRRTAAFALRRLPPDRVPYWDYDSPLIPNDVRDSSAGAILAAGLFKLAAVEPDLDGASMCRREARNILASLWESYSSRGTNQSSILIHGTRNKPRGAMDHGLIYGDYYFVEALLEAIGNAS